MRLIYDYNSYRSFLKDVYLFQKDKNPSFSFSVFAKQLGLSSPAHIQLILSGRRNLTVHNIHRAAEGLALPRGELEYFETMVHCNQAQSPSEKKYYDERLTALRAGKPRSSARLKVSSLLSSGILPALLLSIDGKRVDGVGRVGESFGFSEQETAKILNQLVREKILEIKDSKYRLSQRHLILHDRKAQSQAQKSFLSQQLRLSQRAFERMYEKEGKFFAHTFTLNAASLERYVEEMKKMIEKITELSDEEAGETVMQLNLQLFPYEKSLNEKGKNFQEFL